MKKITEQADFVFVQGGANVYIIEKDNHNVLAPFVAITEFDVCCFLMSTYKTVVKNYKGEVITKNFEEKKYDMTVINELLSEAKEAYAIRLRLLESIDRALAEGDKEEFMRLTEQLRDVS